ncbi:hypothetical protein Ancab_030178 [Ancistrocladus abbreviatus]
MGLDGVKCLVRNSQAASAFWYVFRTLMRGVLQRAPRLESKYSSDPSKFNFLYSMVEVEVEFKTAKGSSSCTNGLLWLTSHPFFPCARGKNEPKRRRYRGGYDQRKLLFLLLEILNGLLDLAPCWHSFLTANGSAA